MANGDALTFIATSALCFLSAVAPAFVLKRKAWILSRLSESEASKFGPIFRLSQWIFLVSFTLWIGFLQSMIKGIELDMPSDSAEDFRGRFLLFRVSNAVIVILVCSSLFKNLVANSLPRGVSAAELRIYDVLIRISTALYLVLVLLAFVVVW